jgi:hypothetical protein
MTFTGEGLIKSIDNIESLIENHRFSVKALKLDWRDIEFKLTNEFKISGVDHPKYDKDNQDVCDNAYIWRHEATTRYFIMTHIVNNLLEMFKTEEEEKDAA